jgi:hypothetical protein
MYDGDKEILAFVERIPGLSKLTESLKLPTIDGLSEDQVRSAFIDLWLWQAMRKHAIKLQHTPENVVGAGGSSGIREWNGKFSRKVTALLEARGLKQWLKNDYVKVCEPAMRGVFAPGATGTYYLQAAKIALDVDDKAEWIRCERCTSVSPRNHYSEIGAVIARATRSRSTQRTTRCFAAAKPFIAGCGSGSATRMTPTHRIS